MTHTNSFRRRVLRGSSALSALAFVGAGFAATTLVAAPAAAQDYTSGAVSGTVTDEAGNPISGATVTATSNAQGFSRSSTTSSGGNFQLSGLAPGAYTVVVEAAGQPSFRADDVLVRVSSTVSLDVVLSGSEEIVVTGTAIQRDFVGTTTGLNVDLEEFVKTKPLARDLTSVILLTPGASLGDSAFGNLASIGGSTVAENAYYINGLNITNFDNYLGSARVPFEFYRAVDTKSGGYPAEFGRATGGIVNAVTKSGTNNFEGAVHLNWHPDFLRDQAPDLLTCSDATGICTPSTYRSDQETSSYSAIIEGGGPIIRDRLFVYGLVEFREETSTVNSISQGTSYQRTNNDPFWGAKIDAYPIDDHHLEFTIFDTRNTEVRNDIAFSVVDGAPQYGTANAVWEFPSGGLNYVGKYTGQLTDWFTVSAAYGRMRDRFDNRGISGGASSPFFQNGAGFTISGVPQAGLFTGQTVQSLDSPYETERKFYRGDVDLFFNLFGDHHVRAGFDQEDNTLNHVAVRSGGDFLFSEGFLTADAYNANFGGAGAALILRPSSVAPSGAEVEVNYFNSGGAFSATNRAFYIQDEWRVNDRLTLSLGVRRDDFGLDKADGSTLVRLKENYSPRVGFTYDVGADRAGQLFGSYGTYFLPIASNTAFRQASSEIYFRERFEFEGIGSNGLPILGDQIVNNPSYQTDCPFSLTPGSSGEFCSVTGRGIVPDTSAAIAHNLKATEMSEFIIGYRHSIEDWTFGLEYTRRRLETSAEDMAIDAAVNAYCIENDIEGCEDIWTGFHQYVVANPGQDLTINLSDLDQREVTFTAEELGYPAASRKYDAVVFSFDKAWNGFWSVGGSYTWSKARGNSEGFVQSDFGQDDSGITQDFDQPGFLVGANGRLPSDRRHRLRLWGNVAMTERFTIGTAMRIDSPRPLSCLGYNPNPNYFDPDGAPYSDYGNVYGAASRFCNTGEPIGVSAPSAAYPNGRPYYASAPITRGEGLETDWLTSVDLSFRYNLNIVDRDVTLRADVFNLFNAGAVTERQEVGDAAMYTPPGGETLGVYRSINYGQPTSYQPARYVRLGLDIEF